MTCPHCGYEVPDNQKGKKVFCCPESIRNQQQAIEPNVPSVINHWDNLHRYAYTTPEQCELDYREWQANIPNYTCSCSANWKLLTEKNPPDFSSAQAYFDWGVARHNDVNESLGKPIVTLMEAMKIHKQWRWMPTEETITTPKSDLLIITVAIGNYSKVLDVSRPFLQAYAKHCGADYVELTNETQPWWGLEKFRVKSFQPHYKRIIFIDCDVLIKPNSPSLFEWTSDNAVGMHDDYNFVEQGDPQRMEWANHETKELFESQGIDDDYRRTTMLNTGVVIFSQDHDIWNAMQLPFPGKHCDEQFWVERQCYQHPVSSLPTEFNTQWWMKDFAELKKDAWFVHYANSPNRADDMQREVDSWSE